MCVELYLNGGRGRVAALFTVQAAGVAELSGNQFLSEHAVNAGLFPFCISPRTVLRKDFAAMCDGCPVQMQTFRVAKPRAAASHYF